MFKNEIPDFTTDEGIACSAYKNLEQADLAVIRSARKRAMAGLSDESLERYIAATRILISVRYKPVGK
jgi:hypothetical protein